MALGLTLGRGTGKREQEPPGPGLEDTTEGQALVRTEQGSTGQSREGRLWLQAEGMERGRV